jgi:cobalt-zinc-cadmium efflux system protein
MRPLTGAIALTAVVFCAELAGGYWTGSLALMADATHMAVDLLGLGLSLFAAMLARLPADPKRTYGYRRVEVLAALGNAVALMVATGFILREAWARWQFATPIAAAPMLLIATLGFLCNLGSAAMLWRGSHGNINLRGALLHVLSDAAGSVGAMLAAFVILKTRWYEADAVISALICVGIVFTALWLLRDSTRILLEGAPPHLDLEEIKAALAGLDGVREVHDMHLWSLTHGQEAMSGHLVMAAGRDSAALLKAARALLSERFELTHVTLQIETEGME